MTYTLISLLIASPWILWAFYVMVMGLYRAHLDNRLTPVTKVLAYPWVFAGLVIDVAVNLTVANIVFLELPSELLVTDRLKRLIKTDDGWRAKNANWICNNLLDIFDPTGNHC